MLTFTGIFIVGVLITFGYSYFVAKTTVRVSNKYGDVPAAVTVVGLTIGLAIAISALLGAAVFVL